MKSAAVAMLVLALCAAVPPASDTPGSEPLKRPVSFRIEMRDGTRVRGKASAFDHEGFDGEGSSEAPSDKSRRAEKPTPFTRARWIDIAPDDLEDLLGRLLDERRAEHLLLKGELLLTIGRDTAGSQALAKAIKLDPALKPRADDARARSIESARRAEHAEYLARHQRMSDAIPKSGAKPWPPLSLDERAEAISTMKSRAEAICRDTGFRANVVETRYFMLFGAVEPAAMQECARSLDAMYEKVLELFGIPAGLNLFWGKAVVFLTPTEDTFRAVEAAGFKSMTPKGVVGLCHQMGPMVFVNMFWSKDQDAFDATLIHETVHGIMHRYFSAERLPAWADEGLSEYIASVSFRSSPIDKGRLPQALAYIRAGRSVADVMRLNYGDGSWPGPDAIGYAVGYASVKLMVRQQPEAFGRWIRAVKGGKPWEQALREDFGHPLEQFAPTVERWYRTNG